MLRLYFVLTGRDDLRRALFVVIRSAEYAAARTSQRAGHRRATSRDAAAAASTARVKPYYGGRAAPSVVSVFTSRKYASAIQ
jgi:hypothetical protein